MKFEEQESIDDSSKETVLKPEIEENEAFEKIEPMLDYGNIKSSKDIEVPPLLIDQVIGHEESIETIKKAAKQRRNILLIGDPGVGKSMLAKGMAQILPHESLEDILIYPNVEDNNHPLIRSVPAGEGKKIVKATKGSAKNHEEKKTLITTFVIAAIVVIGFMYGRILEAIIAAALILLISIQIKPKNNNMSPKLLVNNEDKRFAPFMDATGAHAGALLGDVRHDPYQSGGLGTPAHERVESGMIHKANKGVLYIDEIGTMTMKTQQELLSAMQEKKYAITGQSENSSGAMVRSQAVPCDFVLVASGNLQVLEGMHIAMRSRIRGYGYEVFMKDSMEDTPENRKKLVRFVAQEVKNDGRIPHFAPDALDEIILEANEKMEKTIENLLERFKTIRAGRANPAILDGVKVEYYGTPTPLNQLATVSVPEARRLQIKPFDKSCLANIEKAIFEADLGLTPNNTGELIFIAIPELTEDRRREFVKQAKTLAEEAKIALRNIRQDANNAIKKDEEINEDMEKSLMNEVQDLINDFNKKVDEKLKEKEEELMTI